MKAELDGLLAKLEGAMDSNAPWAELFAAQQAIRGWWLDHQEETARWGRAGEAVAEIGKIAGEDALEEWLQEKEIGNRHPIAGGLMERPGYWVLWARSLLGDCHQAQAAASTRAAGATDQIESREVAQVDSSARGYATADQVELGLAQLETMLDDEQLNKMRQPDLVKALGELGVVTTDRTLRETTWWNCRQDRRASGKRRANDRARVT